MIKISKALPFLLFITPLLVIFIYVSLVYSRLFLDPPSMMVGESTSYDTYSVAALYNGLTQFGRVMLWDNQMGSGSTAIGNSFYQQTNPLIYLLFVFFGKNFLIADRAYFFIHLLAAAGFFYLLTLYLKVSPVGRIVGSVVYMSSQYVIAFTMYGGFRTDLVYITWLPLVYLLLVRALDKLSVLTSIFAGLAFSMFVHEGAGFNTHLAMIFLGMTSFLYILFGLVGDKPKVGIPKLINTAKILVVFLLFSFMFSAIKLLPVMEYLQYSNRSEYTLEQAEGGISLSHYWYTLLKPALTRFFWTIDTDTVTQNNFLYIHVAFYFLIFLSLLSKKKKIALSLFFVSIFAIITGAAQNLPVDLYALFYNYFPGFKSVRLPPRFLVFLWLTFPLLVALSVGWLTGVKNNKNLFLKTTSALMLILIFAGIPTLVYHSYKSVEELKYFNYIPSMVDTALQKLKNMDPDPHRVFIAYHGANYKTNTMPMYRYTAAANDGYSDMSMNIYNDASPYFYDVYDYDNDPIFIKSENESLKAASKKWSILNLKYFALSDNFLPNSFEVFPDSYVKVSQVISANNLEPRATILEIPNVRSRFSFLPWGTLYIGEGSKKDPYDVNNIRKVIFADNFNLSKGTVFKSLTPYLDDLNIRTLSSFNSIILGTYKAHDNQKAGNILKEYESRGGGVVTDLNTFGGTADTPVNFKIHSLKEDPGRLEVSFESDKKGFFVYSNLYYPGWEAVLDGERVPLYMADSYVKGIAVPSQGQHRLLMYYSPKSFYLGAAVTTFAFLVLIYLIRRQSATSAFDSILLFFGRRKRIT